MYMLKVMTVKIKWWVKSKIKGKNEIFSVVTNIYMYIYKYTRAVQ